MGELPYERLVDMNYSNVLHAEDVYQIVLGLAQAAERPTARHRLAEALAVAARLAAAEYACCLSIDANSRQRRVRDAWMVAAASADAPPRPADHSAVNAVDLQAEPLIDHTVSAAADNPDGLAVIDPATLRQADTEWNTSALRSALGLPTDARRVVQAAWAGKRSDGTDWPHPMLVVLTSAQDQPAPDSPAALRLTSTLRVFFRGIAPIVHAASRQPSIGRDVLQGLTPRLRQLLALLLQGMSGKDAATKMGLTLDSSQTYTKRLYRRVGVRSRNELVNVCQQLGIRPEGLADGPPDTGEPNDDTPNGGSGGPKLSAP